MTAGMHDGRHEGIGRGGTLMMAAALLLAGCGQTGPLYLPERGEVATRPASTASPPAPSSSPAGAAASGPAADAPPTPPSTPPPAVPPER
jgi:predicted small lipoprotein YifL